MSVDARAALIAPWRRGEAVFGLPALLSFACGLLSQQVLDLSGQLFVTELCLPAVAVGVSFTRSRIDLPNNRVFMTLLVSCCLMLVGYMVSDLVAGTDSARYLRGWSRVVALVLDAFSLSILASRSRWNLWWFLFGVGASELMLAAWQGLPITTWKTAYGEAFATLALNATAFLPVAASATLSFGLGVVSIWLDSRSLGAVLLAVACIPLIVRRRRAVSSGTFTFVKLAIGALVVAGVTVTVLNRTANEFFERRGVSDINRFAALEVGARAILDSPIVGHGSWGQGTEQYANELHRDTVHDLVAIGAQEQVVRGNVFLPHSQLIQAWMEGGVLAGAFFLLYGFYLVRETVYLVLRRPVDRFTALFAFLLLMNLWHLVMSPFLGVHRLNIAAAVAVLVILSHERTTAPYRRRAQPVSSKPSVVR